MDFLAAANKHWVGSDSHQPSRPLCQSNNQEPVMEVMFKNLYTSLHSIHGMDIHPDPPPFNPLLTASGSRPTDLPTGRCQPSRCILSPLWRCRISSSGRWLVVKLVKNKQLRSTGYLECRNPLKSLT